MHKIMKEAGSYKMFLVYFSLCIIYVVFSLGNWIAPPVVDAIGPKITMLIGAVMYWLVSYTYICVHDICIFNIVFYKYFPHDMSVYLVKKLILERDEDIRS